MILGKICTRLFVFGLSFYLLVISFSISAQDDAYPVEVWIGDTTVVGAQTDVLIPVYLKSLDDSVAGFEMHIYRSRTDLVHIKDTVITEGTLIENWDYPIVGHSDSEPCPGYWPEYFRIKVIAPDQLNIPFPQTGETPLFYLLADIVPENDCSDGMTSLSFRADEGDNLLLYDFYEHTYPPIWELLGEQYLPFDDSVWYECDSWDSTVNPPECTSWTRLTCENMTGDSLETLTGYKVHPDPAVMKVTPGRFNISCYKCGDLIGDDGKINLADITAMISFVYLDGDPPLGAWAANVDGDPEGKVNLSDITKLISHVYLNAGPLNCYAP